MNVRLQWDEASFVAEYLRNGAQARRAAETVWPELTRSGAAAKAQNLLKRDSVIEAVMGARVEVLERAKVDAAWVLERAARLADFNIGRFIRVDDRGRPVYDFSQATEEDWYCITEVTTDNLTRGSGDDQYDVERIRIKTDSKLRALELVGRHVAVSAWDRERDTGDIHIHIDGKDSML